MSKRGHWWRGQQVVLQVSASLASHAAELPDLVAAVRVLPMPGASKEALQAAWRQWIEAAGTVVPVFPPDPSRTAYNALDSSQHESLRYIASPYSCSCSL